MRNLEIGKPQKEFGRTNCHFSAVSSRNRQISLGVFVLKLLADYLGYRCEQHFSTCHLIGVFLDSFPGFLERIPCPNFALEIGSDQFLGASPKHKDLQQILIRIEPGPQPETGHGLALEDDLVNVGLWRFVRKTAINRYGAVFR